MVTTDQTNLIKLINRTLERIADAEQMIENMQTAATTTESASIHQYKHLKCRLAKDLDDLLQKFDGNLHLQYIDKPAA